MQLCPLWVPRVTGGLQKCTDKYGKGLDDGLSFSHNLMTGLLFLGHEREQMYDLSPGTRDQAQGLERLGECSASRLHPQPKRTNIDRNEWKWSQEQHGDLEQEHGFLGPSGGHPWS